MHCCVVGNYVLIRTYDSGKRCGTRTILCYCLSAVSTNKRADMRLVQFVNDRQVHVRPPPIAG